MNSKLTILKIVLEYNDEKPLGFPALDHQMNLKHGIFGGALKELTDSLVQDNLLVWTSPLSIQITDEGIEYVRKEIKG